jgi:hypothetical protein
MTTFWTPLLMVIVNVFRMQWRRRAMWFAVIVASGVFPLLAWKTLNQRFEQETAARAVAEWTSFLNHTAPLAYGIGLADRLPRDRRLHVDELLDSLPSGPACGARRWAAPPRPPCPFC